MFRGEKREIETLSAMFNKKIDKATTCSVLDFNTNEILKSVFEA